MTEDQASNDPIPLMLGKRVHVVRDSPLTGAALELEVRRDIWLSALHGCVQTLRIASRSRERAMQAGNNMNWDDIARYPIMSVQALPVAYSYVRFSTAEQKNGTRSGDKLNCRKLMRRNTV